ncbi:glycosyltransferase family 2 protein [Tropicibacter oceani]|uniref:Glycosyltransferase family 2 protein n=1 Tax=Tropicibacter oceani TaxID=3058420 RepID=A0ABY8QEG5_9RHOB|nr:glycosyltransferase family 2 protein [Tropicibacter oceani]WGW02905.1 glycosyltransferase family 2 protein [Tropicibacter oceani]
MKICALTMVYRDYWALSRWYAHHGAQLGPENLFIVAHGADPQIAQICPGASVITIPRDDFANFDRNRAALLNGIHAGLVQAYDWVIRTDADELICFDPDRYNSLVQAFEKNSEFPVLTALGFDLVEMPGDAPLTEAALFSQRTNLGFSGHYSKAIASRRPIEFLLHGVRVAPRRLDSFPFAMPRGLFLAHLKYANRAVLDAVNKVRMDIANRDAPGLPGTGWSEADADAARFHDSFAEKKLIDWDKAEQKAFDTLSVKPARIEKSAIVKTRALKLPYRTRLPARFGAQG